MYRLVVSSASSACLSSYIAPTGPSSGGGTSSTASPKATSSMARLRWRGFYLSFVLFVALVGTSHSKIIEFICQGLGKQNSCEVSSPLADLSPRAHMGTNVHHYHHPPPRQVHQCAPGEAPQHKHGSRPEYNG